MIGTDATTGKHLSGLAHLKASIRDILTTPRGSRVMRREYGSRIFELVDSPINNATLVQIYAETAYALDRWEPRFRFKSARFVGQTDAGRVVLEITGEYLVDGQSVTLEGIVL